MSLVFFYSSFFFIVLSPDGFKDLRFERTREAAFARSVWISLNCNRGSSFTRLGGIRVPDGRVEDSSVSFALPTKRREWRVKWKKKKTSWLESVRGARVELNAAWGIGEADRAEARNSLSCFKVVQRCRRKTGVKSRVKNKSMVEQLLC